jgi:hypothetical protein
MNRKNNLLSVQHPRYQCACAVPGHSGLLPRYQCACTVTLAFWPVTTVPVCGLVPRCQVTCTVPRHSGQVPRYQCACTVPGRSGLLPRYQYACTVSRYSVLLPQYQYDCTVPGHSGLVPRYQCTCTLPGHSGLVPGCASQVLPGWVKAAGGRTGRPTPAGHAAAVRPQLAVHLLGGGGHHSAVLLLGAGRTHPAVLLLWRGDDPAVQPQGGGGGRHLAVLVLQDRVGTWWQLTRQLLHNSHTRVRTV